MVYNNIIIDFIGYTSLSLQHIFHMVHRLVIWLVNIYNKGICKSRGMHGIGRSKG